MIAQSIIALLPLLALQVAEEEPRGASSPAAIEAIRDHLRSLEGSIRYSLLKELHLLNVRTGPPRQKLEREVRDLAERVHAGDPPTYDEALELARRCFDAKGNEGKVGPNRIWFEYTRSGEDVLNVTTFGKGLHITHLLSGDLALHFLSSANRILVKGREKHSGGSFMTPGELVYPVNIGFPTRAGFDPLEWTSERNDREVIWQNNQPETNRCNELTPWGETLGTTWRVASWTDSGARLALFIQSGEAFPRAAAYFAPRLPDEELEEYVLTFFRTIPVYSQARSPFGFYEVLSFDAAGGSGQLWVERMTIYDGERLEPPSPDGDPDAPLLLPVRFTPHTILQVVGGEGPARTYPADRSTWPSEYYDLLEPWK